MSLGKRKIIPMEVRSVVRSPGSRVGFIMSKVSRGCSAFGCDFPMPICGRGRPFMTGTALYCFPGYSEGRKMSCAGARLSLCFNELGGIKGLLAVGGGGRDVRSRSRCICRRGTEGSFQG